MIKFSGVSKYYGNHKAVDGINFTADKGKTLVLLGESGCGKTTTLKLINKLIIPDYGDILIDDESIGKLNTIELRRRIGYVIQDKGLFPHYTVRENIALLPGLLRWNKSTISSKVDELLQLVELNAEEFENRYPYELSGGQQQRVSIARSLAADPAVVLMDEPFGALDNITRKQVRSQFKKIESLISKTIILVTHDISEAIELGDKICLMHEGKIEQIGTPHELLFSPKNEYVKEFFKQDKFLNELQLTTLKDIIKYIEPSGSTSGTKIKISSCNKIKEALDVIFKAEIITQVQITDGQGKVLILCSLNDILSAFVSFKAARTSETV